ncbi:MAG TPA: DUF2059 domain-containing protein [Longimicrobium sp.]|nr:DUF2059 domain-containing protein [Longimicrobium sp.]
MKKILCAAAALVLALGAGPARAQPSAGQRAAATELLMAMHVPEVLDASVRQMLDEQIRAAPELQGVQDVMREFARRFVSWEALREQYVDIYASSFTEDELREMTDFYRSDVGQKLARATPRLMALGAELGQRAVQAHRAELEQMIRARMGQPGAPPPAPPPPAARP